MIRAANILTASIQVTYDLMAKLCSEILLLAPKHPFFFFKGVLTTFQQHPKPWRNHRMKSRQLWDTALMYVISCTQQAANHDGSIRKYLVLICSFAPTNSGSWLLRHENLFFRILSILEAPHRERKHRTERSREEHHQEHWTFCFAF